MVRMTNQHKVLLLLFGVLFVASCHRGRAARAFSVVSPVTRTPWQYAEYGSSSTLLAATFLSDIPDAVQAYQESEIERLAAPVPRKRWATLALDGGGARGLITAYVLKQLETELREQTGKDVLIGEVFDVIAGTSTGSILATYLTASCLAEEKVKIKGESGEEVTLDGSADSAIKMYEMFAQDVFGTKKIGWMGKLRRLLTQGAFHSAVHLEEKLKEAFGTMTLKDLAQQDKLVDGRKLNVASLIAVTYDMTFRRPAMFIADRMKKTSRFLALDPFSEAYSEGGFQVLVGGEEAIQKRDKLVKAHVNYTKDHDAPFSTGNLGDLQAPIASHLPSSHFMWSRSRDQNVDEPLDKICRFSSAAPLYFPPGKTNDFFEDSDGTKHNLECTDGGLVANVPAQAAFNTMSWLRRTTAYGDIIGKHDITSLGARGFRFWDSRRQRENDKDQMVLSIGCGQLANKAQPFLKFEGSDADSFLGGVWSKVTYPMRATQNYMAMVKYLGNLAIGLISVLMSSNAQISHVTLEGRFCSEIDWKHYLRIQLSGNKNPDHPGFIDDQAMLDALDSMDTATDETLEQYRKAGKYLAFVYKDLIKDFVRTMIET